jgi:5-methylcytosine-specific restriction endonuclease McrBC GTP-binding regulatory subunit McrB
MGSRKAGEIFNFYNEITEGDVVLAQDGHSILGIGKINSEYNLNEDDPFPHQKSVKWEVLNPYFKNTISNQTTVYEISDSNIINLREKALGQDTKPMNTLENLLKHKKQIILQGPPGTGKTYTAKDIAEEMIFGSISSNKKQQKEKLESSDQFVLVQFHPSYSYEDFVRGIVTKTDDKGNVKYEVENKTLAKFAKKAANHNSSKSITINDDIALMYATHLSEWINQGDLTNNPYYFDNNELVRLLDINTGKLAGKLGMIRHEKNSQGNWTMQTWVDIANELNWHTYNHPINYKGAYDEEGLTAIQNDFIAFVDRLKQGSTNYVLIIDEINRANLPSVLGELIYALEYRNESVQSIYAIDGDNSLVLPDNLYIIGTMNTADRSVGHIDYAIKRRFAFVDVLPKIEVIKNEMAKKLFGLVSALFVKEDNTNSGHLASDFDYKDVQLGHSYFILKEGSVEDQIEELNMRVNYEILPILNEYIKDGILLESARGQLKEISGFGV